MKNCKLQIVASIVFMGLLGLMGSAFAVADQKEAVVPPPRPDAEWTAQNQALVDLVKDKKNDEALQKALATLKYLQDKNLPEGQEAATTYNNLGMIYLSKNQLEKAQVHLLKALALRTKLYGPNAIEVGTVWLNLSQLYKMQAEYIFQLNKKAEGAAPQAAAAAPAPAAASKVEPEKKADTETKKTVKRTKKK